MDPFPMLPGWLSDFLCVDVIWWGRGDCGFSLLGPGHLLALAACALAVVMAASAYRRMPGGCGRGSRRRRALLAVSALALCSLALTNALYAVEGVYSAAKLPLYTCNLCEFLDLADALAPRRWLDEASLCMGVLGGTCGLLFCGWSGCPIWSVSSVTGFLEHACIVAFPLMRVAGGDFSPRARDAWVPAALTLADLAVVMPYNVAFGTNFMFVPDPMGAQPLQAVHDALGNPAYAMLVVAATLLGYLLVHGAVRLARAAADGRRVRISSS
jgi:hypothetical protein